MNKAFKRRRTPAGAGRLLLTASSTVALAFASNSRAAAQEVADQSQPPAQSNEQPDRSRSEIVVTGSRAIVAPLQGVPVEQDYDEGIVDSYDAGTIGELLDQIQEENGDRRPAILVNGQRISDPDEIAGLPVEAISHIEALPRGAAQRIGGAAGERAYNVVLKPRVQSATLAGSHQLATEGGWSSTSGEALLTYIKGQDRLNLAAHGSASGNLFESERDLLPRVETIPYSTIGNIIPVSGVEIDPVLSALAGKPVSVVALEEGNPNPSLAQLVAGANRTNPSEQGFYRTLRGAGHPYDIALTANKVVAPWLSLSFNGRLDRARSESFNGLPSGLFLIPAANPYTPFSTPVYMAINDPSRPLRATNRGSGQTLATTANATFGKWRTTIAARWHEQDWSYTSASSAAVSDPVPATTNPFAGMFATLIPIIDRKTHSKHTATEISADADGPLLRLWAGPILGRLGASAKWIQYDAKDISGERSFERHEYLAKAGLTVPLTSTGEQSFLPALGDSELALDVGRVDLGRFGTLKRHSFEFNWQPTSWLRFVATSQRDQKPVAIEYLSAPELVTPNVPYFDPLTGNTVEVTTIFGSSGSLRGEDLRTRMLSGTINPLRKYRVQLNVDYVDTNLRNEIGSLPSPSSAVVAAFPDRFQRDSSGTLVVVDNRFVNFARRETQQLRFGGGFTIPLVAGALRPAGSEAGATGRRVPPLNLEFRGSYTVVLHNRVVIREGLPEVDLLRGGASGVSGGQQRHVWDFNLALTKGKTGLRANVRNRGVSYLVTGNSTVPGLLTFHAITTMNIKAFTDLGQLFPASAVAKDTRLSLGIDNAFNKRQRVEDQAGNVPNAYQRVRLDALGRTVMLELRKTF